MDTFAEKIHACWLGKAIGGTLGAPFEGLPGPHNLEFYEPVPKEVLPNDDLDLQVAWAHCLLASKATSVTPALLAEAWAQHIEFPMDEYGICLRNRAYGLKGQSAGEFDNWFGESMGAAIRSELWACLAPGHPARAAVLASADAVCDHSGDGVWAEIFLAALESAAFTDADTDRLLDAALAFLPAASRVRLAVSDTRLWWAQSRDWQEVRRQLIHKYKGPNFTDVAVNMGFTVLGWLAGGGDFGRSICIAVNCGEDSDCTGATLGALLGIIDPSCIPSQWSAPMGDRIKLSPEIVRIVPPASLDELTEWTLRLRRQLVHDPEAIYQPAPCRPPRAADSPIHIPVGVFASRDESIWTSGESPWFPGGARSASLPGHWICDDGSQGEGSALVLRFTFETGDGPPPLIMAFSYARTAVWVDGQRIPPRTPEAPHSAMAAPSFHRSRYSSEYFQPTSLATGTHELILAWDRTSGRAIDRDLIVGLGDPQSFMWQPFGLATKN